MRAETAEDRILRAMAQFSKVTPLASQIPAQRGGSALIASVEARWGRLKCVYRTWW